MKTAMRIVAVLSFGFFFVAGSCLVAIALPESRDYVLAIAIGLFLMGVAFFAGGVIWFLAEKCYPPQHSKWKKPPGQMSP